MLPYFLFYAFYIRRNFKSVQSISPNDDLKTCVSYAILVAWRYHYGQFTEFFSFCASGSLRS